MARDRELLAEVTKSRTTAEELKRQLTASEETLASTRLSLQNSQEMLEASEARVLGMEQTAGKLKEVVSDNSVSCVSISPRLRKPLSRENPECLFFAVDLRGRFSVLPLSRCSMR